MFLTIWVWFGLGSCWLVYVWFVCLLACLIGRLHYLTICLFTCLIGPFLFVCCGSMGGSGVVDLADDVSLFSSYFSFLHLYRSYSPQTHLQSSHCIVTVYILTHNVLPASPGRAHKKSKQSTTNSVDAHCTTSQSRFFLPHISTVQGIFLAAWPIRFLINPYSQSQGTQSQQSLTILSINL